MQQGILSSSSLQKNPSTNETAIETYLLDMEMYFNKCDNLKIDEKEK